MGAPVGSTTSASPPSSVLSAGDLDALIGGLAEDGYRVLGPTVVDAVIDWGPVRSSDDLPRGWVDDQRAGRYRAEPSDAVHPDAAFAFASPASAPKRWFLPPTEPLFRATRRPGGSIAFLPAPDPDPAVALVGVRGCDLAALAVLDRALAADPAFRRRRDAAFVVAVECGHPADSCFCPSAGTGPGIPDEAAAAAGADLVLTELVDEAGPRYLARPVSAAGAERVVGLGDRRPATPADIDGAATVVASARDAITRTLPFASAPALVRDAPEAAAWDQTVEACLLCGNCTMACPTCFCTSVHDRTDVAGTTAERWREWDSCFSLAFSELHGGSVRESPVSRYRQWLTHKLGMWPEQFGSSGCVGCGRCITWCPAGIDLTRHVAALAMEVGA